MEDCQTSYCPYRTQKTTHFHCNRSGCQFIFKNKADMEKHKNFHMKDEQLNKDGFKKFMKQDDCGFAGCRFSKTVNHIHCIRPGCDYVLHSSGQLYAHKRKHERKETEVAYRKYKIAQGLALPLPEANGDGHDGRPMSADDSVTSGTSTPPLYPPLLPPPPKPRVDGPPQPTQMRQQQLLLGLQPPPQVAAAAAAAGLLGFPGNGGPQPFGPSSGIYGELSRAMSDRTLPDDAWRVYMLHFDSGEGCGFQGCELEETEHYHCKDDGCEAVFGRSDGAAAREHGRNHFIQERITERYYLKIDPEDDESLLPEAEKERRKEICGGDQCPHKGTLHYHCLWVSQLSLSHFERRSPSLARPFVSP